MGGLVRAGEALLDTRAVGRDVLLHLRAECLAGGDDRVEPAGRAHLLGGEVGVRARAVPVTGDGLRVES